MRPGVLVWGLAFWYEAWRSGMGTGVLVWGLAYWYVAWRSGMGPSVIVLQEKVCLLLWPDSGNSSLQISQRRDVAVRFYGLSGFKEIQKDNLFPTPKGSAHHFTR